MKNELKKAMEALKNADITKMNLAKLEEENKNLRE